MTNLFEVHWIVPKAEKDAELIDGQIHLNRMRIRHGLKKIRRRYAPLTALEARLGQRFNFGLQLREKGEKEVNVTAGSALFGDFDAVAEFPATAFAVAVDRIGDFEID